MTLSLVATKGLVTIVVVLLMSAILIADCVCSVQCAVQRAADPPLEPWQ